MPPYQVPVKGPDGFNNVPLTLKYRFLAGNEEQGNYIVTGFLAGSIPYGRFASSYASITPTIAFGKGFRKLDFQSTIGWTIPTRGRQKSGTPVAYNTAFQYRVSRKLRPEVEGNATFWPNGSLSGQTGFPFSRSGGGSFSPVEAAGDEYRWRRADHGHTFAPIQSREDPVDPLSVLTQYRFGEIRAMGKNKIGHAESRASLLRPRDAAVQWQISYPT